MLRTSQSPRRRQTSSAPPWALGVPPSTPAESAHQPGRQDRQKRLPTAVHRHQRLGLLEAMKMEQPLNAHKFGTMKGLSAEVGASLTWGATICEIKD
ncbi:biotin/lipoyl-containing protein [Streptomyces sp. NPDC057651]|uniref:biotin/lipoyl-containing protein n=1 Tax=Streptomyces sp. NPDC057651 TaxID=3346194 RepID=UPI0036C762BC